jgi:hypothetical protein
MNFRVLRLTSKREKSLCKQSNDFSSLYSRSHIPRKSPARRHRRHLSLTVPKNPFQFMPARLLFFTTVCDTRAAGAQWAQEARAHTQKGALI